MFRYLNVNPKHKEEEDCVCRAITLATKKPYEDIQKKLYLISELLECDKLCVCCYSHLLEDVFKYPPVNGYKDFKIKDFLRLNDKGTFIIRIKGHLTCAINGDIYDIWDCTNERIDKVWRVV